jgi:Bacterial Ig-like domain (group 3)
MSLVNQQTGQRQGNANYVLYKLAAQSGASCNSSSLSGGQLTSNTCVFYDTTKGNISVACKGGTPNCSNATAGQFGVLVDPAATTTPAWTTTAGYDRATGLGSVNVANLLAKWNTVSFTPSTTTITSPASGATFTHGQSGENFTVTVSPSSATGDVSLIAQPVGAAQVALPPVKLSAGTASFSTNLLPGGTAYPVVAHYAGDGTVAASDSAPVTVTVTTETSKTVITMQTFNASGGVANANATTAVYGSAYVLRVDVTNSAGTSCANGTVPCPTGKVTITDNGAPLNDFGGSNSAVLSNLGFLEDQPVQLPVGTHALVAVYAGDNSYTTSTSAVDSVSITQASTATTVTSTPASVATGGTATLTAIVATTSSGVAPTGTVQFMNGSTPISGTVTYTPTNGSTTANASLKATLSVTFSNAGAQTITAKYSGDTNYATSTSTAITVNVGGGTQATTTTVTSSATSISAGGSVTLTAKVTGTTNNGPGVTGSVQFMNGSTLLGSGQCGPTAGTSSTPGSCMATLTPNLSFLMPRSAPRRIPRFPVGLMWIATVLLLMIFLLTLKCMPFAQHRGYAYAGLLFFACVAAGIMGCSGAKSSSSGGGSSHVDSITGVYSGDSNYAASTSTAVTITIQ